MIKPAAWFLVRVMGAILAGAVIIVAASAYRFSQGPISLAFLSPYLEEAMRYGRTEISVKVDDTVLTWAGWDRTLDIRALGVVVRNADGVVVASVPEVSLGLSVRALVRGRVVPTTIDVIGVKAHLTRTRDGHFDFGLGGEPGGEGAAATFDFLVGQLMAPPEALGAQGYLRRISIVDATLTLDDQETQTSWEATEADLVLTRDNDLLAGSLTFSLQLEGNAATVSISARLDPRKDEVPVNVLVENLYVAPLALKTDRLLAMAGVDLEVAGTMDFTWHSKTGTISDVRFDVSGGPGLVDVPEYYIDNASVDEISLKGALLDDFQSVRIDSLYVNTGGPIIEMRGLVALKDGRPSFNLEGGFRGLPVNDLGRYWPPVLAPDARAWVTENIRGGTITEATVKINVSEEMLASGHLPADSVTVDFAFEGLRVDYLHPMPRIGQTKGNARLDAEKIDLKVESAVVGDLRVSEGILHIEKFSDETSTAHIGFVVAGSVADSLALADEEPLKLASALGILPKNVGGDAATRLKLEFPLTKKLTLKQVQVVAAANLANASMRGILGRADLTQGSLSLKVNKDRMVVEGKALIQGIPSDVSWREEFHGKSEYSSRYVLNGTVDEAARERLGFESNGRIRGPVQVSADLQASKTGAIKGDIHIDVVNARVSVPELPWRKEPGTPGNLDFSLALSGGDVVTVPHVSLTSKDLVLEGQGEFGNGKLRRLDIGRLAYGGNEISASVRPQAPEGFIIAIEGRTFNLAPHIDRFVSGEGQEAPPPLKISARLQRLALSESVFLTDVSAQAGFDGERWTEVAAGGSIDGKAGFSAQLTSHAGRRLVRITSPDAGAAGRASGLFDNGVGGTLELNAQIHDDKPGTPVTGDLLVEDFRVVNAPVLAQILTLGSLAGIHDVLVGEGILFTRTAVPFEWTSGKVVVKEARAIGTMGVTLDGTVSTLDRTVRLEGTIVPAYTLNSVLGNIPIIGKLLVGRKGEGIFAVTYGIVGQFDNPKILVNPLSALAPGILRNMFRFGSVDDPDLPPASPPKVIDR